MTWVQVGWSVIALAVVLLVGFSLVFKTGLRYHIRQLPAVNALIDQRVIALERGEGRLVVLGNRFWSRAYPGLGLHALSVLPSLVSPEVMVDGGQVVSAGAGELVLFARQILEGGYRDGFSTGLDAGLVPYQLPGPTPLAFTAGLLTEINLHAPGSLVLFGSFGLSAPLWAEAALINSGNVFAAAGLISAQAALFLNVRDVLIGEEVFMLPGALEPTPVNQAGWLTEDILRVALMVLILAGAVLKMVGVI